MQQGSHTYTRALVTLLEARNALVLSCALCVCVCMCVCVVLQAVIHRDLKPANLMIGGGKVYTPYHRQMLVVSSTPTHTDTHTHTQPTCRH